MNEALLLWNVYEINSEKSSLNGVMLRGRIRKLGIEHRINVLVENTEDIENGVRFALIDGQGEDVITEYVKEIIDDAKIRLVLEKCPNPVLSKLKVNIDSRYKL